MIEIAQHISVTRFEIGKAEAVRDAMRSRLSRIQQYLSDLTENLTTLKSKSVRAVSLREFSLVRKTVPRLRSEETSLLNAIFAKTREIEELRADLRDTAKIPTATILEFRCARPKT